jgi:hypothetical protein
LLLFDHRFNQLVQVTFKCWINCAATLLNASIVEFHIGSRFERFNVFVFGTAGQMVRKYDALRNGDIEGFGESFNPKICVILRLGVVAINY